MLSIICKRGRDYGRANNYINRMTVDDMCLNDTLVCMWFKVYRYRCTGSSHRRLDYQLELRAGVTSGYITINDIFVIKQWNSNYA